VASPVARPVASPRRAAVLALLSLRVLPDGLVLERGEGLAVETIVADGTDGAPHEGVGVVGLVDLFVEGVVDELQPAADARRSEVVDLAGVDDDELVAEGAEGSAVLVDRVHGHDGTAEALGGLARLPGEYDEREHLAAGAVVLVGAHLFDDAEAVVVEEAVEGGRPRGCAGSPR